MITGTEAELRESMEAKGGCTKDESVVKVYDSGYKMSLG